MGTLAGGSKFLAATHTQTPPLHHVALQWRNVANGPLVAPETLNPNPRPVSAPHAVLKGPHTPRLSTLGALTRGAKPPPPLWSPTLHQLVTKGNNQFGRREKFLAFGERAGKLVSPNVSTPKMLKFEWRVQVFFSHYGDPLAWVMEPD